MRSLKIKGCNYILLSAVNLSLKQITPLVWVGFFCLFCCWFWWGGFLLLFFSFFSFFFYSIACPEKERTALGFGLGSLQIAKKRSCYVTQKTSVIPARLL